jgi:hypothetical protein
VTATVAVTLSTGEARETRSLALVREDGAWRIDLIPDEMAPLLEGLDGSMESMATGLGNRVDDALRSIGRDGDTDLQEAMRSMAPKVQRALPGER